MPERVKGSLYTRLGKRLMDIVLSTFALVTLSPHILLIALAIRFTMGPR